MATFTTTKATLDSIAQENEQYRKQLEQAKALIDAAVNGLTSMATKYGAFGTQLDTDATANAGNAAWDAAKAEKDQLVADFQAQKTRALSMQTAVSGL